MTCLRCLILLSLLAIQPALTIAQSTNNQGDKLKENSNDVKREWLLVPKVDTSPEALLNDLGLREIQPGIRPFGVMRVYADKTSFDEHKITEWRQRVESDPRVQTFQRNHQIQKRGWPSDPEVTAQWHHYHPNGKDLDSDSVWPISKGGLNALGFQPVVAIIEGFDPDHPDLEGNTFFNTAEIPNNLLDDDGNGYIDDHAGWNPWTQTDVVSQDDHGTAVAGMTGAISGNAFQGAGVAPDVSLIRIDIGPLTEADVVAAYSYAHDLRSQFNTSGGNAGAFIVATNASWGIDYADPSDHPIWCAVYDSLLEVGILNCAATANLSIDVDLVGDMPTGCASEGLISVTALDSTGARSQAAYGANSIDMGAPGKHLLLPSSWDSPADSSMSLWNGTSFASPAAAGVIALIYGAQCPEFAGQALSQPAAAALRAKEALLNGTVNEPNLNGITTSGGRLHSMNAVLALMETCADIDTVGCTVPGACNFNWFASIDDGSCDTSTCIGCTDLTACNFAPLALQNDGHCAYPALGLNCEGQCLWNQSRTASLEAGTHEFMVFSGEANGGDLELSMTFNSGGGAWAADQVLILVSPDGTARQLGGFSLLSESLLPGSIQADQLQWSGSIPFSWGTNAPGNFTASFDLSDMTGSGIWRCYFINAFSGNGVSTADWNFLWNDWCALGLTSCPQDVDGNSFVTSVDLLWLLSNWGCEDLCIGDIDMNNQVGAADLILLLSIFGEGCQNFD